MTHDQARNLRMLAKSGKRKTAKTIAVVSGKGGVGKSNIAINFSLSLQQRNQKVLLIDFDIGMGNVEVLLGLSTKKSIVDMFENDLPVTDVIERGPGFDFISGGSGLTTIFGFNQERKNHFFTEFQFLTQTYDFIIFDMGAGVTLDMMFFILASDECIVITTPEPTSVTDGYGLIKQVVNNQPNMPIYVVMNRSETSESGIQALQRFKQVIKQFLNSEVVLIGNLPNDNFVQTAVSRQTPFILLNKRAPISRAVDEMAENYLTSHTVRQETSLSFIQKLKGFIRKRSF